MAPWLHQRLTARGLATEVVTAEALCMGARWSYSLGQEGARLEVVLADGRRLRKDDVRWVVNRLVRIPDAYLLTAEEGDASYAEQELRALLCSALQSLCLAGITVVEPPDPYSLSGTWRSPAEWALLAARAGLPVRPWRWHDPQPAQPPMDGPVGWALVIGQNVVLDAPVPEDLRAACGRLAFLARMSLLHVVLMLDDGGPATFFGVAPLADPRVAGERAVDALVTLLDP